MLENAVFWGAGCAIVWGFSDYIARLAGRSVGPMAATFAMMMVGGVPITAIMAVMGTPVEWRLDGLHWLLAIGAGSLDPTMAVMTGKLKLSDMGAAMALQPKLGALFAKMR